MIDHQGSARGFLCMLLISLSACMPSRRDIREAQALVAAEQETQLTCQREDRCALPSPLLQALESPPKEQPAHFVSLIEYGQDALLARVHLIRAARRSVDLQSFIFTEDDSGTLLMRELIAAARRGVKVRVLVDQLFSADDPSRLAQLSLLHRNLEIQLYNPTFGEAETGKLQFVAGIVCCFTRFNQRMHNKLLLIDGVVAITGGRNVQNRYFDWGNDYNYRDRDLLIGGPVAKDMQRSFEQFWAHRLSVPTAALRDVYRELRRGRPLDLRQPELQRADRMLDISAMADSATVVRDRLQRQGLWVGAVEFHSDQPNKPFERRTEAELEVSARLRRLLADSRQSVVLQTPYLVFSKEARRQFRRLQQRDDPPEITISTNSLAATDAFPVYALSHKYKRRYLREFGFQIFEYKPFPAYAPIEVEAGRPFDAEVLGAYATESRRVFGSSRGPGRQRGPLALRQAGMRVGLHAKSMVVDNEVAVVGTHNFDPRSDQLNTESFVLIRDAEFARLLQRVILRDTAPENAWTIAPRPKPRVLSGLNYSLGKVSEALPVFDIWPWRYATSWELKPDCQPIPYRDPRFYDCYVAVGDFPEVELGGKSLSTRILTAFGAGLSPIL
ncbi:phospholipase D family protein [Pseudomarimonas arenosa]|uniref:phospholipase D family protein n=1 Tax=Pseudomarimonas arenosa TaxID=2774145 RepID=UPI001CDC5E88|nr:phospholipase D family protein [Pseudomarimonas arenosa]